MDERRTAHTITIFFFYFSPFSTVRHNDIERRLLPDSGAYIGFKVRAFRLKNRTEKE